MTVKSWDAQKWHQQKASKSPRRSTKGPSRGKVAMAVVGMVILGAAAVSADDLVAGSEMIGVCHVTASDERPYVYLAVEEDSFEHGHHRHHADDFFVDPAAGGCSDEDLAALQAGAEDGATANGTDAGADEAADTPDAADTDGDAGSDDPNATDDAQAGGTDDGDDPQNGTADEDAATDDGTDGAQENDTADGAQGNDTTDGAQSDGTEDTQNGADEGAAGDDEAASAPADLAVDQRSEQDDVQVRFTIKLTNVGERDAQEVTLWEELPQLYRTWHLSGDDAADCVLEGRDLDCWFDALAPGESVAVTLQAYTDRMACGQPLTGTAWASASDDANEENNGSSASISARQC